MSLESVPIIDFADFLAPDSTLERRRQIGEELVKAYKEIGFAYIKNYGIKSDIVKGIFDRSKWFFDQPFEEKLSIEWDNPESNRGYVAPGREKLSNLDIEGRAEEILKLREKEPDLKESLEIGRDDDPRGFKNRWVKETGEGVGFRSSILEFYDICNSLQLKVMSAIALGLGLEEDYFEPFCNKKDHTLRLLHYPKCTVDELHSSTSRRAGEHTDYGSVTLLFQEPHSQGGLQVRCRAKGGEYVHAPPLPDTIIVNVGDLLQHWSNDILLSNEHRVVAPPVTSPDQKFYEPRYTVVFFSNPNFDATISCIPACATPDYPAKYPSVNSLTWLASRLGATYGNAVKQ
eukprot:TRINITY_DN331_c0_g2_i1.p1 TRINITY_DN331_c0_g2~~TRINITY_DN331_c0_g2_i1.p1  ORF type:complete len:386 (-),score=98.31 TRINITY_DN331_c0_g2_i1:66-1100(-)